MIKSKTQKALLIGLIALSAVNVCFADKEINSVEDIILWISRISNTLSRVFWIASGILILWTAWDFLTSKGATDKVKAAQGRLIWIAFGIGVAILASNLRPIVESLLRV